MEVQELAATSVHLRFHLPRLTGRMLADVVQRKGVSAGGLGWLGLAGVQGFACLLV